MLQLRDVSFTYPGAKEPVLAGFSLQVSSGERVALVGPNGSGKSTIVALANGSLIPSSGVVFVDGLATNEADEHEIARLVGVVRQDPRSQLLEPTVFDEVAFGPRCLGLSAEDVRERVVEALTACGLERLSKAETSTLSGGQQQLLALAGVLAMHPSYLVLDEATAFLDQQSREAILALIERLRVRGVGILQITHRLEETAGAERVYHLEGKTLSVREAAGVKGLAEGPVTQGRSLRLEEVGVSLGGNEILSHLSFEVPAGQLTLLCGPSGAGKTTTARVLSGTLKPDAGMALLGKERVRPGMVGLVSQRPDDQLFADTVWEDVAFAPRNLGLSEEEIGRRVAWALTCMGIDDSLRTVHPSTLSGGQRRRVALAGILAMQPEAYVFDEPIAGLDEEGRELLRQVVEGLLARSSSVLVITHDPEDWEGLVGNTVILPGRQYRLDLDASSSSADMLAAGAQGALHAGSVILALLMITMALFAAHSWLGIALGAAFALVGLAAARVKPAEALFSLRMLTIVLAFTLLANGVVVDGTADLPLIGVLGLSYEGILHGAIAVARIVTMLAFVYLANRHLSASSVSAAFVSLLRPLEAIGLPVSDMGMIISITLRSIPEAMSEFDRIKVAQEARCAPFTTGSLIQRTRTWTSVLVPLVVALFERADDLARAMRDRCYAGHLTPMGQKMGLRDIVFIVMAALLSMAIWRI